MTYFRVESNPTFRDINWKFAKANKELLDIRREEMRTLGRQFVKIAGAESPGGEGHTVARGIRFRTFVSSDAVGFSVTPGKIGQWHIEGTGIYGPRRRRIRSPRGKVLAFEIGGTKLFRWSVKGVRPTPFFQRAYDKWEPLTRKALQRISTRWTEELT